MDGTGDDLKRFVAAQDSGGTAAGESEAVRVQRLREDGQRPTSVNLAEGIALSHKLIRFSNILQKN